MTVTTQPLPGTIASHNPEPSIVSEARALLSSGVPRREIVARIASMEPDRDEIESAHTYWVRRMPRFDWEDHTGNHILLILEELLREVPRGT